MTTALLMFVVFVVVTILGAFILTASIPSRTEMMKKAKEDRDKLRQRQSACPGCGSYFVRNNQCVYCGERR
jgi:ribosomal protein L32